MRSKTPHKKRRKRVGCGIGSGHGKRATRGQKGQRSRSGYSKRHGFEGGQNPLYRRLPKRGFNRPHKNFSVINIGEIARLEISEVNPEILVKQGALKKLGAGLKVLGDGELKKAVKVQAHQFSESAKAKIEKAGGSVVLISQ